MPSALDTGSFILSAFDREQWCPILQARFQPDDLEALRSILGEQANDDPELRQEYILDDQELAAVNKRFGVDFDTRRLQCEAPDIVLFRMRSLHLTPYLVHTGYELPLLLEGRKKLARISNGYPPATFDGEDRFNHYVATGTLHQEEVIEPFERPVTGYVGLRTVYYTPKGEEWRIPAMKLITQASGKSGGWNEHFERLEGMLFGYTDWQNDWWIDIGVQGGGFGGIALCCAVSAKGLAWLEAAGFRALPPIEKPTLALAAYDRHDEDSLSDAMLEDQDSAVLVRFNVLGRHLGDVIDLRHEGPWHVPHERIADLNRDLRGPVIVMARRTT